jgi:hypothetical protein
MNAHHKDDQTVDFFGSETIHSNGDIVTIGEFDVTK